MNNWIDSHTDKDSLVISSKVWLMRNFKDSLFTNKLSIDNARNNVDKVFSIIENKYTEEELTFIKLWECDYEEAKVYLEKQLISEALLKNREKSAFIVNKNETLSIMINEDDNLRIQCITGGLNLLEAYNYINKIDNLIEKEIPYAFNENLGFLTSSLSNVGTGFKASVLMHLPAITISEEFSNISNGLNKVGINMEGLYLEGAKAWGNIYEISNQVTLGIKEEEIIKDLEGIVDNIINEENKFREVFQEKYKYEIEDKIFRAYGTLKNAILLKPKEVLDLLSYLRFGIEISLLDVNKDILNKLLIETRNSIIQTRLPKGSSNVEQELYRAKIVRDMLV